MLHFRIFALVGVVACSLLGSGEAAAGKAGEEALRLVTETQRAAGRAVPAKETATRARAEVTPRASRRKDLAKTAATALADLRKHSRAGDGALAKARADVKLTSDARAALVELARKEYEAAVAAGSTLLKTREELRRVEDELNQLTARASTAAAEAKSAAEGTKGNLAALDRVKKGENSEAAASVRTTEKSAADITRLAKLGEPSALAVRKEAAARADAAFQQRLAEAKKASAAVEARLPSVKQCDVRKVDFGNFEYPDFTLKNGNFQTEKVPEERSWTANLHDVDFVDTDASGSPEAWVAVRRQGNGPGFGTVFVHVFESDKECRVRLLGVVDTMCFSEPANVSGNSYVVPDCNGPVEHRLVDGTPQPVKGR